MLNKICFIDLGIFAQEGPTSGLLVTICEILRFFRTKGWKVEVISFLESSLHLGRNLNAFEDIPVQVLKYSPGYSSDNSSFKEALRNCISTTQPSVIITNLVALFLKPEHLLLYEICIESGAKILTIAADTLFPNIDSSDVKLMRDYCEKLKKTDIFSTSLDIQGALLKQLNLQSKVLPTLISLDRIRVSEFRQKYITLVNHHPIKGREVFNSLIRCLPDRDYLVVETWPDIPPYVPPTNKVVLKNFVENVKEIYSITKILVVPSLCREGPSRVVTEGLVNGIPIVAHNIGSIPEVGGAVIKYVDPPVITSTRLEGSILYPIVEAQDLVRVGHAFAKNIKEIELTDNQENKIARVKHGLNLLRLAEEKVFELISTLQK